MDGGFFRRLGRPPLTERLRAAGIREDLIDAAGRTAFGRQCDDEVVTLPALLTDDEVVQQLLEGRYRKATGLLVLTTRRIVFVAAKAAHPQAALVIDRADVLSASGHTHRWLSALTLSTPTGDHVIDQILGSQAETFANNTMQTPEPSQPATDPLVELAELRALHQAGAIGDAEYQTRKRRLIDLI
jgi:hypothetical protein